MEELQRMWEGFRSSGKCLRWDRKWLKMGGNCLRGVMSDSENIVRVSKGVVQA